MYGHDVYVNYMSGLDRAELRIFSLVYNFIAVNIEDIEDIRDLAQRITNLFLAPDTAVDEMMEIDENHHLYQYYLEYIGARNNWHC